MIGATVADTGSGQVIEATAEGGDPAVVRLRGETFLALLAATGAVLLAFGVLYTFPTLGLI